MSVLTYDGPRRFSRPASARTFPQTYYNERHAPIDYARADPYALPMGGPVSPLRTRSHVDRDEFQPEQGGARRRIAVAVSQSLFNFCIPATLSCTVSTRRCILYGNRQIEQANGVRSVRVVARERFVAVATKATDRVARTARQLA